MTFDEVPLPGTQPLDTGVRLVRCSRCHRELSDAESRLYALGPGCRHPTPPTPRGWDVEQDQLPGVG
ncbi:hypothetical protein GXW83_16290 [Streptacidiphilus sp. PB12-B1b]|uniref:DUF6011 domain-containing protein n=1 Tax=Streptacidiphilus sp. PB12-B1b TaxID=2705012 RepID=UPI0015FBB2B0|nr:DUF6011 domain-containing protein [Streptacidiphilus sp. PB12-B1b]QMU77033.1 hypothetical protein GXW83_16290 [Streptacidiphilus sp. PB12-B1b]